MQRHLIILLALLFSFHSKGQEYADPEYYLIDSLVLEDLSDYDRELLDTTLVLYHNTTNDTVELGLLEHIVDRCWEPTVWPRYNRYLINQIKSNLTINRSKADRDKHLYYMAGAISNIGYYYDEQGDLVKALDLYHESLKLYESVGSIEGAATTFNNLGVLYSVIGDTAKAIEYHTQSLEYKKKVKDLEGVAMSYNNIGTLKENKGNHFEALEYYEASLKLRLEINDRRGIAMSYDNIGDVYYEEGVFAKAQEYYNKAFDIWKELRIQTGIAGSYNNLAKLNYQLGNFELAKEYGVKSYELSEELGFPVDIENSSRSLIDIFEKDKDYKSALEYAHVYINTRNLLRGSNAAQIALKKSMQYQYEKLAIRDSLQYQREKEVQDLKLKKQETQTYALYSGFGFLLIILIVGIRSYRQKQKDNQLINEQKLEVENQKEEIEKQHIKLAETHQEISDSISYAKRIQEAILPTSAALNRALKNGFVFYRPKDVVSGDFYWLEETENDILFAVADCTGHGVPGAMVSVVCHNALTRAVREFHLTKPSEILDKSREIVVNTLEADQWDVKDGMDISVCAIKKESKSIEWAGAYNPLYIVEQNGTEVQTVAPNKQPVGKFEGSVPFTNHSITLNQGDSIYLFTDGFMDQFGGERGKKYKYAKFKTFLLSIQDLDMNQQKEALEKEILEWMGSFEQIDDMCIAGIRFD